MGTIVVTGAAGGIGRALRARLTADGHEVVGVDRVDADVVADLAGPDGRAAMVAEVTRRTGGVVDGVVAAAGIQQGAGPLLVSVNHFGAVATLEGLRPLLVRSDAPAAVAIASNSATCQPGYPVVVAEACLAGDEEAARAAAADDETGLVTYPATKLALARWVRHRAPAADWIGADIRLNAIAPGLVDTPMTTHLMDVVFDLGEVYPIPLGRATTPDEVAALVTFLLGPDARAFCGSVVVMDGGTEAALRAADWPAPPGG